MNLSNKKTDEKKIKNQKTSVRVDRIVIYVIMFAFVCVLFWFFHSHFILFTLVAMVVLPIASIVSVFYLRNKISVKVFAPDNRMTKNENGFVILKVENPSFIASLDARIQLEVRNDFYNKKSSTNISIPIRMREGYELSMPIKHTLCGMVAYNVSSIRISDILGFVRLNKEVSSEAVVFVYPDDGDAMDINLGDYQRGMTETEESNKKGSDFSAVSDVREYIPGDKLMSIHWKLSAKRDILMVKDRESMSDQQLFILTDLAGGIDEVEEIVCLSYRLCRALVKQQVALRLVWWSEQRFEFDETVILVNDDITEAFSRMYYEKIYTDTEKTIDLMRQIRPEIKAYVRLSEGEGGVDAYIIEQD